MRVGRSAAAVLVALFVAITWLTSPPTGLSPDGYRALGLIVAGVAGWTFRWMEPAFTALWLLLLFVLTGVAGAETVFGAFGSPVVWMLITAFLMNAGVEASGLGYRLADWLMGGKSLSWTRALTLAFLSNAALAFFIPMPPPRSLLILSILAPGIRRLPESERAAMGFAVFLAGLPTTLFVLTGDSVLNGAAIELSGIPIGWLDWLTYMGVPTLIAGAAMIVLHRWVFGARSQLVLGESPVGSSLSAAEWRCLGWVMLAVGLWATDSWHGIHPAWVMLLVVCGMATPIIGGLLTVRSLVEQANWPMVIIIGCALAMGKVAGATGLSAWLAQVMLPGTAPGSIFGISLTITAVTMAMHMILGTTLTVETMLIPAVVVYANTQGLPALPLALLVHTAAVIHFVLPHQHLNILLGSGSVGGYGARETLRYGLPLTLLTLVLGGLILPLWWQFLGIW